MIQFFIGDDINGRNKQIEGALKNLSDKGFRIFYYNGDVGETSLLEYTGGRTLFNEKVCVVVHSLLEDTNKEDFFVSESKKLIESDSEFIFIEREIKAPIYKLINKHKIEYKEFFLDKVKGVQTFNIFSLGDALMGRNKKLLWVLYEKAKRSNISPEDIFHTLNWQIKNLYTILKSEDLSKLEIKPFVIQKTKKGLSKFSPKEIIDLSEKFTDAFHKWRRGGDISVLLEQIIISI